MISAEVKCGTCSGFGETWTKARPGELTSDKEPCVVCNGAGQAARQFSVVVYQEVNLGDHAETIGTPVSDIPPDITVKELLQLLNFSTWKTSRRIELVPSKTYDEIIKDLGV